MILLKNEAYPYFMGTNNNHLKECVGVPLNGILTTTSQFGVCFHKYKNNIHAFKKLHNIGTSISILKSIESNKYPESDLPPSY